MSRDYCPYCEDSQAYIDALEARLAEAERYCEQWQHDHGATGRVVALAVLRILRAADREDVCP